MPSQTTSASGVPPTPTVFFLEGALADEDCRLIQAAMDQGVTEPAEILGEGISVLEDVRRAAHVEVPEEVLTRVGEVLDAHRDAISASLGRRLRAREGASLLRYDAGGFYRRHVDRADVPSWPPASRREVTVVLFLDSSREVDPAGGFTGGRLRLLPGDAAPLDVESKRGLLVAFPADVPHEVTPVIQGRRDTVVDWFR